MSGVEAVVAVGSARTPKLRAVARVLEELRAAFPRFLPGSLRIEARPVPSGVAATPRNVDEAMEGARRRAESVLRLLRSEGTEPRLALGLEGGLMVQGGSPFLHSWAYATDGERGYFGSGGAIPVPGDLAEAVLVRGEELGGAADRYFVREDVAANEGTFGVLTRMRVSREEAFVRALLHALAPFYNPEVYGRGKGMNPALRTGNPKRRPET